MSYGVHWFRRDLRVAGNPALQWSWKEHSGRVLGLFCFDSKFLSRKDFSANRFGFFLDTLSDLQKELRSHGSDLLVLDVGPDDAFNRIAETLQASGKIFSTCSFNRDYEPFALQRDSRIEKLLKSKWGIRVQSERDHILIEPHELLKSDGTYYQIYSAYAKRWYEMSNSRTMLERIEAQKTKPLRFQMKWKDVLVDLDSWGDVLEEYRNKNQKKLTISLPKAGAAQAMKRLSDFKNQIGDYSHGRDFPAQNGTSGMSIFLKNGSITTSQIIAELDLNRCRWKQETGPNKFLKEIVWREFYYSILYHCPRVESEAFREKYKTIPWENNEAYFRAWQEGLTGYPIVDAGMRQLKTTGWMHNRVRMIVASFLTKDLHIDWRWGEQHFMNLLLDGDLAPNNGGWQWAASTGVDPQPYFRIFNPLLQSKKFDPDGAYIRKYVPELKNLNSKQIHEPKDLAQSLGYPAPIINHASQKLKTLRLYSS